MLDRPSDDHIRHHLIVNLKTLIMNNINTLATLTASGLLSAGAIAGEVAPMTSAPDATLTLPGLAGSVSMYGYIDIAGTYTDGDGEYDTKDNDTFEAGVPEVEIGFAFDPADSPWSAVAELSFRNLASTNDDEDAQDDVVFETVTASYAFSDALSLTVGNILSYQGFETYDATGLYQFSYAGPGSTPLYSAGYAAGMSLDYVTDAYGFGAWVGESDKGESLSTEFLAQYTDYEGLTAKFIFAGDSLYKTYNPWASYEIGNFTLAAEYVHTDYDSTDEDTKAFLAMVNYSFGKPALTLRYSGGDAFNGDTEVYTENFNRYTISPSYAFSDNVLALLEYSYETSDADDNQLLAAELLFMF